MFSSTAARSQNCLKARLEGNLNILGKTHGLCCNLPQPIQRRNHFCFLALFACFFLPFSRFLANPRPQRLLGQFLLAYTNIYKSKLLYGYKVICYKLYYIILLHYYILIIYYIILIILYYVIPIYAYINSPVFPQIPPTSKVIPVSTPPWSACCTSLQPCPRVMPHCSWSLSESSSAVWRHWRSCGSTLWRRCWRFWVDEWFNGHFRNRLIGGTDSIYKAYFSGLFFRGYPPKIWPEKWYSTSNLGSFFIPIDHWVI